VLLDVAVELGPEEDDDHRDDGQRHTNPEDDGPAGGQALLSEVSAATATMTKVGLIAAPMARGRIESRRWFMALEAT
jgi:hypothetical protein